MSNAQISSTLPQKLLVIRNDKLGDFMLIIPALALIKKAMPSLQITALVPRYTAPMAQLCPFIDEILLDCDKDDKTAVQALKQQIKNEQFDAVISFFSNRHNAKLVFRSGIPYRLAPATKIYQFFYNHRLKQRRSQSLKAEFAYNEDLAREFLRYYGVEIPEHIDAPYLPISTNARNAQRQKLVETLSGLDASKAWVFVHSGSGGSATNLSLAQYAMIIADLLKNIPAQIILTAGPGEAEQAQALAALVAQQNPQWDTKQCVFVYAKNDGLADFTHSLACADLFISGSTGPLHVAAALNRPTIAFYPSRRSATPVRWQPINQPSRHLAFSSPIGKKTEMNLTLIDIPQALEKIRPFVVEQFAKNK